MLNPEEKEMLAEIEAFLDNPIQVLKLDKTEYSETLVLTKAEPDRWKAVMQEIEQAEEWRAKHKKKNKKK